MSEPTGNETRKSVEIVLHARCPYCGVDCTGGEDIDSGCEHFVEFDVNEMLAMFEEEEDEPE